MLVSSMTMVSTGLQLENPIFAINLRGVGNLFEGNLRVVSNIFDSNSNFGGTGIILALA